MKRIIFYLSFSLFTLGAFAQNTKVELAQTGLFGQSYSSNSAKIYINADAKLLQIIKEQKQHNQHRRQIRGWRIRVYMGSGRNAREQAEEAQMKAQSYFSDVNAHVVHQSPYFQVVVGDFRSRIEAEAYRKKMLKEFPDCYVVESKINVNN